MCVCFYFFARKIRELQFDVVSMLSSSCRLSQIRELNVLRSMKMEETVFITPQKYGPFTERVNFLDLEQRAHEIKMQLLSRMQHGIVSCVDWHSIKRAYHVAKSSSHKRRKLLDFVATYTRSFLGNCTSNDILLLREMNAFDEEITMTQSISSNPRAFRLYNH